VRSKDSTQSRNEWQIADERAAKERQQRRQAKENRKARERAHLQHPPIDYVEGGAQFEAEHTDDEYQEFLTDAQVEAANKRDYFRSIA
jgi:hypothetical protein